MELKLVKAFYVSLALSGLRTYQRLFGSILGFCKQRNRIIFSLKKKPD